MEAAALQRGFKLGDWVVRPRAARMAGPAGTRNLAPDQLKLLLLLAGRPDEAVRLDALAAAMYAGEADSLIRVAACLHDLRALLGGSGDDRHYIVFIGADTCALVADVTPLASADVDSATDPRATTGTIGMLFRRLQRLLGELRRRSVFKVVGAYLVGMWIMLQVAEVTFEPLHFPRWWMTALTILAVLGLPIVAALAWSYEITPAGIVADDGDTQGVSLPRARRAIAPALVAGVTLMAGVTGYAWWKSLESAQEPAPVEPADASIAVLPLVDMSPGSSIAYLGEGLAEELSATLAQVPGLRVASRTSAFEFKDRSMDVRRIGQSLGVRHVLEGSVRRDGDRVRVTMQLIDATNGYHVWARSYDRRWSDVIAIQDDIARAVTNALKLVIAPAAAEGAGVTSTPDVRAIEPYLAGLALVRKSGDLGVMREAENRFGESIDIAPDFARAHAALCRVRLSMYQRTHDDGYVALAEAACRRALELDPALLETEKGLAELYLASGRTTESVALCRSLVERYPSDADGYLCLGAAQQAEGAFEEAERSLRAAVRAEPSYWVTYSKLGGFLFEHGRTDEAIAAFREVVRLTPSSASAYANLGATLQFKGDDRAAEVAYGQSLAIEPSASVLSNLGTMHYFAGNYAKAVEDYQRATQLTSRDQAVWGNLADAYWQLGDRDSALANYRQAVTLAERDVSRQPNAAQLLAQLGYYHGRLGDRARSDDYFARAAAIAQDDPYQAYYLAVAAADRGDAAAARRFAAQASKLGYPQAMLREDPALKSVLHEPGGGRKP